MGSCYEKPILGFSEKFKRRERALDRGNGLGLYGCHDRSDATYTDAQFFTRWHGKLFHPVDYPRVVVGFITGIRTGN